MNEKKRNILETAMKLFAKNGYHTTSMQEVARQCGIAKGSLYNYFSSKEQLLLSVYQYYYEQLVTKISLISADAQLTPKEQLQLQIEMQFDELMTYREFIQMQMREQALHLNEDISVYLMKVRALALEWYARQLVSIYGPALEPHAYDFGTVVNGMIKEFISYMILDHTTFHHSNLAKFIVNRIDDMAAGIVNEEQMIVTGDYVKEYMYDPNKCVEVEHDPFVKGVKELEQRILHLHAEDYSKKQLLLVVHELKNYQESDIQKDDLLAIQHLLLQLSAHRIQELVEPWNELLSIVNRKYEEFN